MLPDPCAAIPSLDIPVGQWQAWHVAHAKLEALLHLLGSYGSCLVAYSGGVDSVFLAWAAKRALGNKSLAAIADSPSLPRRELEEALEIARRFEFPLRVIATQELENPQYTANPINRCYFCKHELFSQLIPLARAEGMAVIVYGENASDAGDFRPGAQAASEFEIRAPLKAVGLSKQEIRLLSAEAGLPTAQKPQLACLSSRVPYGERVTPEKLNMIEKAEYVLRDLGLYDVRVRHHELSSALGAKPATLARIEVDNVSQVLDVEARERILGALKALGYDHVTVDLSGYRRGSLNPTLATERLLHEGQKAGR